MEKEEIVRLSQYMGKTAEKKSKPVPVWWDEIIRNIPRCQLATHVGKFTHPDVKISLWNHGREVNEGYVSSSSILAEDDILTPAQYLGAASVLMQPVVENGPTVLEDLADGGERVRKELDVFHLALEPLQQAVRDMMANSSQMPGETDGRLKQVYFPIGDGTYHLLSPLTASGFLFELKQRILAMNRERRDAHDPKKEVYGTDCRELTNLTMVGFGGTKPQNISVLNSRSSGVFYMLPSLPPELGRREIRRPRQNFFTETLYYRRYTEIFHSLHRLMVKAPNNIDVRNAIREKILDLVDVSLAQAWKLMALPAGWSEETALPECQKIWLDAGRKDQAEDMYWTHEVGLQFGRWVIRSYEKTEGREAVALGDGELTLFADCMEDVLREGGEG